MAVTRHFLRNLVLALIIGLGLFGILAILTIGVPFEYYPRFCEFFTDCAYQPLFVAVDLLFWIGVAFVLVSTADKVSRKWGEEPFLRYDEHAEVKFFFALLFFGSAILSLWLGLTNGAVGFSGWYIGAIVFAISGSIVLILPVISKTNRNNNHL